ncbi:MAG: hypothetical protein HY252_05130 [Sphingobacteriales bacterium]|nr:hypothetical protein [Sphingobacteriales bacterium]
MKKLLFFLLITSSLFQCTSKKETLSFEKLNSNEFNAGNRTIPGGKSIDSVKHAHDSCMGISFDANVVLAGSKDSLFAGTILNRRTLKVAGSLNELGFDFEKMSTQYIIITNPCYEKKEFHFPLKSIFTGDLTIELPNSASSINKELNEIIAASQDQEVRTGSWVYLNIKQLIKNMMDTIKSEKGELYKAKLLDTSNMVVTAVESIMRVDFIIHSNKLMSPALRAKLAEKPTAKIAGLKYQVNFYLISPDQLQISIDGFFPIIGKFMKVQLKVN